MEWCVIRYENLKSFNVHMFAIPSYIWSPLDLLKISHPDGARSSWVQERASRRQQEQGREFIYLFIYSCKSFYRLLVLSSSF